MRVLPGMGHEVSSLDLLGGPYVTHVGSIGDRDFVRRCLAGVDGVLHTATLHKPHVATHPKAAFVATNVAGTLVLLEEAARAGVGRFVFSSTTSAFGDALSPPRGAPAAWIDETVTPVPKNIYGVTKTAAEDLCMLFAREGRMNVVVLRTSRFFPEPDDTAEVRDRYDDVNVKANEFLFRRVDVEDAAMAHERALVRAPDIGFGRYVISAATPFVRGDLAALRSDPAGVVEARHPGFREVYDRIGFRMFSDIDRVYDCARARADLGWAPKHDFGSVLRQLAAGQPIGSGLAAEVGAKGYHRADHPGGRYPFA